MKKINPNLIKLAELTHNPDLKVDESILEEKTNKEAPIQFKANINSKDYIKIRDTNILISKFEPDEYKNLTWQDTHFRLSENGLFMPTPALFMKYFVDVTDAYKGKLQLYDCLGNRLDKKELEYIYEHLTTDRINGGAWSWLNAKFDKTSKGYNISTDHKVINNELKGKTSPLENCLMEDCNVNLKFNSQGLAIEKSRYQGYSQEENIYFYPPVDGAVALFGANSAGAFLDCSDEFPNRFSTLGVFACAKGTPHKI